MSFLKEDTDSELGDDQFIEESDEDDSDDDISDIDPDAVEVPGGGKDLKTAMSFAKKKIVRNKNSLLLAKQSNATNITQTALSPVVKSNNTELMSNIKKAPTPAALDMAALKQVKSSTAVNDGIGAGASGSSGMLSGGLPLLNSSQMLGMAAYVTNNSARAGVPAGMPSANMAAALMSPKPAALGSAANAGGYYPSNPNFNMAASLLAQMSMSLPATQYAAPPPRLPATPLITPDAIQKLVQQQIAKLLQANPSLLQNGIPTSLLQECVLEPLKREIPTLEKFLPVLPNMQQQPQMPQEEEDENEAMIVAETYSDYMPSKLSVGIKHPDPVVETATLSSVEPCDVYYQLDLPQEVIRKGHLSALQLESIVYASQAHDHLLPDGTRAGFLIGDGAGVGKGRTIAGIIYENWMKGRKRALWVSVSNDLRYDAERDLSDIGATRIDVHPLNKFKYAKISSSVNNSCKRGVIFSTYSALIGESNNKTGKYKSRLKQLLQWCGEDFDGVIVFDECHKAKNLCPVGSGKPTKTGRTVLELQERLPKARVVYASATGASEPKNMAYMVRLGLWGAGTAFPSFGDFISSVEKRGVGAMEIVAMDMKLRGMYIARQLSFHGVTFKIEEVALTKEFRKIYDESVDLWVEAMQKFTEAAALIDAESRMKKTMWGQFWSSHQRFFKYLCIASKVAHVVKVARDSMKAGKCIVIGLQSTGEARTLEQLEKEEGELSDFVSTAKGVFQSLVEKHFPAPNRDRISRILGLSGYKFEDKEKPTTLADEPSSSNSKRKLARPNQKGIKKSRKPSQSSDVSNDSSDDEDNADCEELRSDSEETQESEEEVESENNDSSDFNPFIGSGSDSDYDPWVSVRRQKKKKKPKPKSNAETATAAAANLNSATTTPIAKKKGPISTQDRIQNYLQKKQELKGTMTPIGINGAKINYGPPPKDAIERACCMKEELLRKIERLGDRLPPNTLDQLIDELGGTENVAEMTGRKGRVVQLTDGTIQYETRSEHDVPLETLNIAEKQRFMNGEKLVAIISEAASSGISLQSDRRVLNQRRRVHITLELPWSADRAVQQFGRTHRSNQVNAPEYIFLISDLAGERRFASTVAKRLESLGALTHGDRRATESRDLSQFNIDNKYGRTALETVMRTIMGYDNPLVPPPADYEGDFFKDVAGALVGVGLIVNSESHPGVLTLDKEYSNISKFLNRILGMPVDLQNRLFRYFTDVLLSIITRAKREGNFDLGIMDLGAGAENVTRVKLVRFIRRHATGKSPTELHTVRVERGMIWQEAIDKWVDLSKEHEGFYLSLQTRNNKRTAILAVELETQQKDKKKEKPNKKNIMMQIYRPNTGLQVRHESLAEIEKKYKKVTSDEAETHWNMQYEASAHTCSHAYWGNNCRHFECEIGRRQRLYYVLAGAVLSVWSRVENILAGRSANNKMQVVRMRTTEGAKIVGTIIPKQCHELLKKELSSDAEKVEEIDF